MPSPGVVYANHYMPPHCLLLLASPAVVSNSQCQWQPYALSPTGHDPGAPFPHPRRQLLGSVCRFEPSFPFLSLRDTATQHTRSMSHGQLALAPLRESTSPPGCLATSLEVYVCVSCWLGPQFPCRAYPMYPPLRVPLGLQHVVLLSIPSTCSRPAGTGYVFTLVHRLATNFCFEYAIKASRPSATYHGPQSLGRGFTGIYHMVRRKSTDPLVQLPIYLM